MPGHNKEPMPCEVNCRVHRVNTEDRIKQPGLQLPIHAALEVGGGGVVFIVTRVREPRLPDNSQLEA